jgi:hypothetical protein
MIQLMVCHILLCWEFFFNVFLAFYLQGLPVWLHLASLDAIKSKGERGGALAALRQGRSHFLIL